MKGECCWHLPGNRQCAIPALYELSWEGLPDFGRPTKCHRPVCVVHLVAALDEALSRPVVTVTLVQQ